MKLYRQLGYLHQLRALDGGERPVSNPDSFNPRNEHLLAFGNEADSEGIGYKCNY